MDDGKLVWCWYGAGLVLVWCWYGAGMVLVWCWYGAGWCWLVPVGVGAGWCRLLLPVGVGAGWCPLLPVGAAVKFLQEGYYLGIRT